MLASSSGLWTPSSGLIGLARVWKGEAAAFAWCASDACCARVPVEAPERAGVVLLLCTLSAEGVGGVLETYADSEYCCLRLFDKRFTAVHCGICRPLWRVRSLG